MWWWSKCWKENQIHQKITILILTRIWILTLMAAANVYWALTMWWALFLYSQPPYQVGRYHHQTHVQTRKRCPRLSSWRSEWGVTQDSPILVPALSSNNYGFCYENIKPVFKARSITKDQQLWNGFNYGFLSGSFQCEVNPSGLNQLTFYINNH